METLPLVVDSLVTNSRPSQDKYFARCCEKEHLSVNTQHNRNGTVVILKNIVSSTQHHHSLVKQ
ncbi:hypothetical protein [Acaryochloris marina]|uniref:Uncharacterized protein n=1 Tax=Acaryochloris marina (strain MBIC 11017) TaxID=329726 RepID=B0C3K1_ACAM1|nr:hypothetical protein [Acaryochloris marina]ABW29835.1 hypothetical protein AM1_4864 [Acaryochloris marina MBIC11017]